MMLPASNLAGEYKFRGQDKRLTSGATSLLGGVFFSTKVKLHVHNFSALELSPEGYLLIKGVHT